MKYYVLINLLNVQYLFYPDPDPFHCVKIMTDGQVAGHGLTIEVTYNNNTTKNFDFFGNKPKGSIKTICHKLPLSIVNDEIKEVHIHQLKNSSSGPWRTNGVLVQEKPEGDILES